MKRRILSMVICLAMVLTMLPLPSFSVSAVTSTASTGEFAGGTGTEADPYLIATKEHLNNVRNHLDAHYEMIADIAFTYADFSANGDFYNDGKGWTPIGTSTTCPFTGSFDGNSKTIKGLYINVTTSDLIYAGLFGCCNGGDITNLTVDSGSIEITGATKVYAGGICAYSENSNFNNCYNSNNLEIIVHAESTGVAPYAYVGGISGYGGNCTNCENKGDVITEVKVYNNDYDYAYCGGIVGGYAGAISNCINYGNISATSTSTWTVAYVDAGGIAGSTSKTISNCTNYGNISCSANNTTCAYAGGICGSFSGGTLVESYNAGTITGPHASGITGGLYHSTISNCYNMGNIQGTKYASGIAGYVTYNGEIHNCYNVGSINQVPTYARVGGITGDMSSGISSNCYYVDNVNSGTGRGSATTIKKTAAEMQEASTFIGFDFDSVWEFVERNRYLYPTLINNPYYDGEFAGGNGTEADPYLIKTKKHLNNVRNYLDAHYKMVADIVFTEADFAEGGDYYNDGTGWQPIGINANSSFSGVFDGNGHTISGLHISIETTESFASYTERYVGLFGYATGKIKSLGLDNSTISAYDHFHKIYAGCLVGCSTAEISDVSVAGQITARSGSENVYVAGIAGKSSGSIDGAHFDGYVNGKTLINRVYAAGITGQALIVTNSSNAGTVSADSQQENYAGGISGTGGNISMCYNEGLIKGDNAGGIAGSNSTITLCYNTGTITDAVYAGGILGRIGQISDCYNLGAVSATLYAGGIIGHLTGDSVQNCYNIANVSGATYIGSIAGGNHGTIYSEDYIAVGGTISACYYPDSHTTGVGRGDGVTTACSISKLKKQSTFSGFDFSNTWTLAGNENYFYPELIENELNITVTDFKIINLPTKKAYLEGKDLLNLAGATGQITYSTELVDIIDITSDMVSGFDNTIVGNQVLTVSFGGKTDTFSIEITAKKLTAISMNTLPNQTSYLEGYGQLDLTGATIVLWYNNDDTDIKNVTSDMVSGFDNSVLGEQKINIAYDGKSTEFTITILEKSVDRIEILTTPTKQTYIAMSDEIDVSGGILKVYYNNNTFEQISISETMISGFDNSSLGNKEITVTYGGKSDVYTVKFVENTRDYGGGIGTRDIPYKISAIEHLVNIKLHKDAFFVVVNNIDIPDSAYETNGLLSNGWHPSAFSGVFDGNGYTIKNLKMDLSYWYKPGLFSTNSGTIKNLTIDMARISVDETVDKYGGFICAENNGSIINCHTKDSTILLGNTDLYFGGIAGKNTGVIQDCTSNNAINWGSTGGRVGGISADNSGTIVGCTNSSSIINTGAYTPVSGGIAAQNSGTIISCKNLASVSSKTTYSQRSGYAGGVVGKMTGGKISQCYNTGAVSAVATEYQGNTYSGGIVAHISGGEVSDCYNTADVYGESNSYAASSYVGGIVGYNNSNKAIKNCYTAGGNSGSASSSNLYVGYVCGYNSSNTVENCYYLGITDNGSGFGDFSTIYGNSVTALKKQETYTGFDFNSTWTMSGNGDYPFPELISAPMVYSKKIKSISVETMPEKLKYIQNYELLDPTGGTLKITYEYDEYEIISLSEADMSGFDNSVVGKQSIDVSYLGYTTEFEIEIVEKSLVNISITTLPSKLTYLEGDEFDSTGLIVKANYNNGTFAYVTDYTISGYSSSPGKKIIEISYGGETASFEVVVNAKSLTGIVVSNLPNKVVYLEGESLSTTGLEVTASYNNNTTASVTNFEISGYDSNKVGLQTITITYGGKTATFTVTVNAKVLTGISITHRPNKLSYIQGEKIDIAGLVVNAAYNNGTNANVIGYDISGFDTNKVGQQTITVTYNGKTATFKVTVIALVPNTITSNKHIVVNGFLRKVSTGTSVTELTASINEKQYVKVFRGDQEVSGDTIVGTGMVVKIMDGNTAKASAIVLVTGDTNGDGKSTVTDMLAIKSHLLKKSNLVGAAAQAADTNKDGTISITDFIQVKASILGKGSIVPN